MNRRHVLQTFAVLSAGSASLVAFGQVNLAPAVFTNPLNLSTTLREARELCVELLGRVDRVESRRNLIAGANSNATKTESHALQELLVLLEQAEARVVATEPRAIALLQACVDSLFRVEEPLNSLCQQGKLPRPVVDNSINVFRQVRQLLSSLPAA